MPFLLPIRRPHTVDIPQTWDDGTAELVCSLLVDRYSWPKRTVSYEGGRELEALEPGVAIAITDSDLHLSDAVAYLADMTVTSSGVVLDLILLDHPASVSVSTA